MSTAPDSRCARCQYQQLARHGICNPKSNVHPHVMVTGEPGVTHAPPRAITLQGHAAPDNFAKHRIFTGRIARSRP
jgi:hypothetical protein